MSIRNNAFGYPQRMTRGKPVPATTPVTPGRGLGQAAAARNAAAVLIARDDPPGTHAGFREDPYSPLALAMILAGLPVIAV